MRVETRETIIPAQTKTLTVYVAHDGREFFDPNLCAAYENTLEFMKSYVFRTRVENVQTLDEETAILYNIRNNEDHIVLLSSFSDQQLRHFYDEYATYGPGWYIYSVIDGGDGPDFHNLRNYDAYVKELEDELTNWKDEIQSKITASVN